MGGPALHAENKVIVHEWGTFTCLQDEEGYAIGGINIDDEPVPDFVYGLNGVQVAPQNSSFNLGLPPYLQSQSKDWIAGDPAVTMRLETPVVYFYPPKGVAASTVPPLKVQVAFHGGLLTQFYPYAYAGTVNMSSRLTDNSIGKLCWNGVRMGSNEKPVETNDKVWTTPREVSASLIQVDGPVDERKTGLQEKDKPQAERFLFYRGVGQVLPPLLVSINNLGGDGMAQVDSPNYKYFTASVNSTQAGWSKSGRMEVAPTATWLIP